MTEPPLKYPGGKRKIVPQIVASFGDGKPDTWVEPFCGSAAAFLGLPFRPSRVILADANARLINFHQVVRDDPDGLLDALHSLNLHAVDKARYLAFRADLNSDEGTPAHRAALFLAINKGGFNGLYRENRKGGCNVPAGTAVKRGAIPVPSHGHIREVSTKLQGAEIVCQSYDLTMRRATGHAGVTWVYCDVPYLEGFVGYVARGFSFADQVGVASLALEISDRGDREVTTVISNKDCTDAHRIYRHGDVVWAGGVSRSISCDGARLPEGELMVRYPPLDRGGAA